MKKDIGALIGGLALVVALLAVSPTDFANNSLEWLQSSIIQAILFILGGSLFTAIAFYLYNRRPGKFQVDISRITDYKVFLSSDEFELEFQKALQNGSFNELKIFGYTGETVTDYFKYGLKYNKDLAVKILNRDWKSEKDDEDVHNQKIKALGLHLRPWNKSGVIKHSIKKPWNFEATQEVRYYSYHPIIKSILLCGNSKKIAFLSFYMCEEFPKNGGLQFKGSSISMIFLNNTDNQQHNLLEYLNSQFDYIWNNKCVGPKKI